MESQRDISRFCGDKVVDMFGRKLLFGVLPIIEDTLETQSPQANSLILLSVANPVMFATRGLERKIE